MNSINNRKGKKKIKLSKILFIGVAIYFVSVFCVQQFRINEYKVKEEYYSNAITELNQEKAEYETLASQSNTAEYIEKVAREKLGLVKPYEKIFMDINK